MEAIWTDHPIIRKLEAMSPHARPKMPDREAYLKLIHVDILIIHKEWSIKLISAIQSLTL